MEASEQNETGHEEYEAAAKALGTTTTTAGIDLGHGIRSLQTREYEKRWRDSGSEAIVMPTVHRTHYSDEEMQKSWHGPVRYTVAAFVGDRR